MSLNTNKFKQKFFPYLIADFQRLHKAKNSASKLEPKNQKIHKCSSQRYQAVVLVIGKKKKTHQILS